MYNGNNKEYAIMVLLVAIGVLAMAAVAALLIASTGVQ